MENRIKATMAEILGIDEMVITDATSRDNIEEWDLRVNSEQFKKGLHALKTMSEQLVKDVMDDEMVKSCYRKFKENGYVFMKELLEFYVMNE